MKGDTNLWHVTVFDRQKCDGCVFPFSILLIPLILSIGLRDSKNTYISLTVRGERREECANDPFSLPCRGSRHHSRARRGGHVLDEWSISHRVSTYRVHCECQRAHAEQHTHGEV